MRPEEHPHDGTHGGRDRGSAAQATHPPAKPRLTNDAAEAIEHLEKTEAGKAFDVEFMEIFSRHHFMIVQAATACLVASELRHHALRRLCRGFLENQVHDIDEMRHLLCEPYGICDYQPLEGVEGRHR